MVLIKSLSATSSNVADKCCELVKEVAVNDYCSDFQTRIGLSWVKFSYIMPPM